MWVLLPLAYAHADRLFVPKLTLNRRAALSAGAAFATAPFIPPAEAKIESTNPANNYYFPMAKYRYLPRIQRAWLLVSEYMPQAMKENDWEALTDMYDSFDKANPPAAMLLFSNAVEGSRSGKRKKKTDAQKALIAQTKLVEKAYKDLEKATEKKDMKKYAASVEIIRTALGEYREVAQLANQPNGGVVALPDDEDYDGAGHAGAPLGYVIPTFRGGNAKYTASKKSNGAAFKSLE
jgi:hypothetical protein